MPPKFKRNVGYDDLANSKDIERASLLGGNSDDDFFLRGPSVEINRLKSNQQLDRVNGQVNEVIDVMKMNVNKVLERGERLEDLQDKSDNLASSSDQFRTRAVGLRKQMWWQNCRSKIIIGAIVLIILTVILVPIIIKLKKNKS